MKKVISFLLILLMVISCAVAISSCDKKSSKDKDVKKTEKTPTPELDFEVAEENLREAGYGVYYYGPENNFMGASEGLYAVQEQNPSDDTYFNDHLYIFVFESNDIASHCYDEFKYDIDDEIAELKEEIAEYKEDLKDDGIDSEDKLYLQKEIALLEEELEMYENYVVGKKDNCVWYGTKQAIKDSKS